MICLLNSFIILYTMPIVDSTRQVNRYKQVHVLDALTEQSQLQFVLEKMLFDRAKGPRQALDSQ